MRKVMKRRRTSVAYEGGTDSVDAPPEDPNKKKEGDDKSESSFDISGDEEVDGKGNAREGILHYLKPSNHEKLFKIVKVNMYKFSGLAAIMYIYHLLWAIAGINAYADYTRENACQ